MRLLRVSWDKGYIRGVRSHTIVGDPEKEGQEGNAEASFPKNRRGWKGESWPGNREAVLSVCGGRTRRAGISLCSVVPFASVGMWLLFVTRTGCLAEECGMEQGTTSQA